MFKKGLWKSNDQGWQTTNIVTKNKNKRAHEDESLSV